MSEHHLSEIREVLPDSEANRTFEVSTKEGMNYLCVVKQPGSEDRRHVVAKRIVAKRIAGVSATGRIALVKVMNGGPLHRWLEEVITSHMAHRPVADLSKAHSPEELTLAKLDAEASKIVVASVENINGTTYKVSAGWPLQDLGSSLKFRVSRTGQLWRNPIDNWDVQINFGGGWRQLESKATRARVVAAVIRHIMGDMK